MTWMYRVSMSYYLGQEGTEAGNSVLIMQEKENLSPNDNLLFSSWAPFYKLVPKPFWQQEPVLWKIFPRTGVGGWFWIIQGHYIYCALYFYYYYLSSTSDHQALDWRGWGPWDQGTVVRLHTIHTGRLRSPPDLNLRSLLDP